MGTGRHFGYNFCVLLVVFALLLSGCGTNRPKVYRVGILCGLSFTATLADGFKNKMTELGYVEGENIVYDYHQSEFDMAEYERVIQKFVDDKVDLILVFPTEAASVAKEVTAGSDIPVVFDFSFVENTHLINSVREPGGNLTGVRYPGPDISLRRFEIMRQLVPNAKRIWLPYQRGLPTIQPQLDFLTPAAEAAGITLVEGPADSAAELETSLLALAESNQMPDAIMFLAEPLAVTPDGFEVLVNFAYDHHIPIGGALMEVDGRSTIYGVTVDTYKTGEQAAPLADKLFKGADPATTPVLSSDMFFQINYSIAQQLGVEVPESLLNQADKVIR